MEPFHQSGKEYSTGWHQWEFWQATNQQQLEELAEKIQELAAQNFDYDQKSGMHEYYRMMKQR